MKILISHVYSEDNKGDAALLSILIHDARIAFNSPDIQILTMDKIADGKRFEDVPVANSFMYYTTNYRGRPLVKLLYSFFVVGNTMLWALVYRATGKNFPLPASLKKTADVYREADLIIPVGGGYIRGGSGFGSIINLILTVHPIVMSHIIGKPTILYTQSIGPFYGWLQTLVAKFALKRVRLILVREDVSMRLLKKLGITNNALRSIDGGFMFSSNIKVDLRKKFNIASEQIVVGITARKWLTGDKQIAYEKSMAAFADYIIKKYNAAIILIPQVTAEHHGDDDREANKRIYDSIAYRESVHMLTEHYDHSTIKAMYSNLDYVVGTRFHSVIFGITSYVPAIAIEYEHKTSGIMEDLGLQKWVLKIEDITSEKLEILFQELVSERESYQKHLMNVLPIYIRQADQLPQIIRRTYEASMPKSASHLSA